MTRIVLGNTTSLLFGTAILLCATMPARADEAVPLTITIKDHTFDPSELHAPAGKPLAVRVKNLDPIAAEFESGELHVEKIITPNSEGVVYIRPQKPGRYKFLDDFHQDTTGVLVVE